MSSADVLLNFSRLILTWVHTVWALIGLLMTVAVCFKSLLNPLRHNSAFWSLRNIMYLKILWKTEHLLLWSKCSIFHYIFKSIQNLTFSWIFSMLSKNRKWCHDLKIVYGVNVNEAESKADDHTVNHWIFVASKFVAFKRPTYWCRLILGVSHDFNAL